MQTDTYKEDFLKERDDRASAQGAKEDFKIAKEKAEEENRKLKQRLNDSTTRPKVSGADCGKRSPESSTRCRQLLKQVSKLMLSLAYEIDIACFPNLVFYLHVYRSITWRGRSSSWRGSLNELRLNQLN